MRPEDELVPFHVEFLEGEFVVHCGDDEVPFRRRTAALDHAMSPSWMPASIIESPLTGTMTV